MVLIKICFKKAGVGMGRFHEIAEEVANEN